MPKKTNRKSISLKKEVYAKVKEHCEASNISMSQFVEDRVVAFLDSLEETKPSTLQKKGLRELRKSSTYY